MAQPGDFPSKKFIRHQHWHHFVREPRTHARTSHDDLLAIHDPCLVVARPSRKYAVDFFPNPANLLAIAYLPIACKIHTLREWPHLFASIQVAKLVCNVWTVGDEDWDDMDRTSVNVCMRSKVNLSVLVHFIKKYDNALGVGCDGQATSFVLHGLDEALAKISTRK